MSLEVITNYGIAGVIIYIFYKLFSNELKDLKSEIRRLGDKIDKLSTGVENLIKVYSHSGGDE